MPDLKQEVEINMNSRLDKIEEKLDRLTEAMISMARAEEKINSLQKENAKTYDRLNKLSQKLDDIQSRVDENARTVTLINKLFWVVIVAASGAIATHIWM
tara:strand:+ start:187 stop:486 length:300 start_codon:yes stop_codon:yes gene_type:complete